MNHSLFRTVAAVVIALLAGCGGSQLPGPSQRSTTGTHPESYNQNLLYVSTAPEAVLVYSYPKAKPHGTLSLGSPYNECSDKAGDVFVSTPGGLYEFAHDGASPIAQLNVEGPCSDDPLTGNLAVAYGGVVLVFEHSRKQGWLLPTKHKPPFQASNCGYDEKGNWFVDGENTSKVFQLAELPAKSIKFTTVTLDESVKGPGQVQWDGSYIAIEDSGASPSVLDQFSVNGSTGQEVGASVLKGVTAVSQFWIQGKQVIGTDNYETVAFWNYPAGGSPTKTITTTDPYGVTVSLASH